MLEAIPYPCLSLLTQHQPFKWTDIAGIQKKKGLDLLKQKASHIITFKSSWLALGNNPTVLHKQLHAK